MSTPLPCPACLTNAGGPSAFTLWGIAGKPTTWGDADCKAYCTQTFDDICDDNWCLKVLDNVNTGKMSGGTKCNCYRNPTAIIAYSYANQ